MQLNCDYDDEKRPLTNGKLKIHKLGSSLRICKTLTKG